MIERAEVCLDGGAIDFAERAGPNFADGDHMIDFTIEAQQRERIRTEIFPSADAGSRWLADEIAGLIRRNDSSGRPTVLGLATGSTPIGVYRELIRLHREAGLSFRNVITFNLDEYYGIPRAHPESYWRFMQEHLFIHIDIAAENVHVPDGNVPRSEVYDWCRQYEADIQSVGGIDLQVLGIGRTGHIGFNEPGAARDSRTRLVTLDRLTRRDAARDFLTEFNVPRYAITMGVGTILRARRIVLLAWGESKASVIASAVEGEPSSSLPASLLQKHPDVRVFIDTPASTELTRIKRPWLVGPVTWTTDLARRAVTWLAPTVNKSLLKLLDEDYAEHGMADLLTEQGPAYTLNIRVFNELQHTITGWPGGKPGVDDSERPERANPFPKRIAVLSPEPSDGVLGMGGTLRRLAEQGHDITVIHLTSGNLAVSNEDAWIVADLISDLTENVESIQTAGTTLTCEECGRLRKGTATEAEKVKLRTLKGRIRRAETRASLTACGGGALRGCFLDLAFYEKGRYRQFEFGEADVAAVTDQLNAIKPHQIFVTGMSDAPLAVGAICFEIFQQAYSSLASAKWTRDCRVWLYRVPGQVYDPAEIEMAVPLSPRELTAKVQAINRHQSQRSQSVGEAGSERFWEHAEKSNRGTANRYRQLGLADYEAIEAFRRWASAASHS